MEKLNFTLVENIVSPILAGLPKFLGAIGLLILLYVIAKIVRKVVRIFLEKMKVDKLAEKFEEIDIISKNNIKIVPSAIIAGAIYYMIIMLSVVAITDMLHLTTISNYLTGLITYLPKVFTAFAFLIVGFLFSEFIRKGIYTAGKSVGIPSAKVISSVIFYFLIINVFISALTQAGIDTEFIQSNLTMIIGGVVMAFALGYGLASKDMMSSILAGFYNKRLKEGDVVTIDGVKGTIESITNVDLILTNQDGKTVIPLSRLNKVLVQIHQNEAK
ncbi:MAG: mechanosensitive ion channel [Bacteroidetes bacterium]|jgi:hypothetical protein|nr:mechanosensitive ion channel [Bacteroidota bacterium]